VLMKIHGTGTWAMGWFDDNLEIVVWTVGVSRIVRMLRRWA